MKGQDDLCVRFAMLFNRDGNGVRCSYEVLAGCYWLKHFRINPVLNGASVNVISVLKHPPVAPVSHQCIVTARS